LPPVSRIESNEIASRPVVIECCSSTERLVVTSPFVSVVWVWASIKSGAPAIGVSWICNLKVITTSGGVGVAVGVTVGVGVMVGVGVIVGVTVGVSVGVEVGVSVGVSVGVDVGVVVGVSVGVEVKV
jgi:hypothetical protein